MNRIDNFRSNLDIHALYNMIKEYQEMYEKEVKHLLAKANSAQFDQHFHKAEEIKGFLEEINETIDIVNNQIANL